MHIYIYVYATICAYIRTRIIYIICTCSIHDLYIYFRYSISFVVGMTLRQHDSVFLSFLAVPEANSMASMRKLR